MELDSENSERSLITPKAKCEKISSFRIEAHKFNETLNQVN